MDGARRVSVPACASPQRPARAVVLVSGAGTILQALLDAGQQADFPVRVVGVGSDRAEATGLDRARRSGVETFVTRLADHDDRPGWDLALADAVGALHPDLVVLAGFMKLVGPAFLSAHANRVVNTHPALLPAFPGVHGPADALAYGVTISGATLFLVDAGTDTGPILAMRTVPVGDQDTPESLHERIKVVEREMVVRTVAQMATSGWTVHSSPQRRKVTMP